MVEVGDGLAYGGVELQVGAEGGRLDEPRLELGPLERRKRAQPAVERDVLRGAHVAERGRVLGRHLEELARGGLVLLGLEEGEAGGDAE